MKQRLTNHHDPRQLKGTTEVPHPTDDGQQSEDQLAEDFADLMRVRLVETDDDSE